MNLQKAERRNLKQENALIASLDNNKLEFLRATSAWHFQLANQWEKNYEGYQSEDRAALCNIEEAHYLRNRLVVVAF